jgi:methylated-DNA-protein-cysteine methyltransferase-like protein
MFNPPNPELFNPIVWNIVRQVPEGRVTTYGQIASMIPPPESVDPAQYARLGSRWVGSAMRSLTDDSVPWHRVINSKGEISLPRGSEGAEVQRALLEMEGVAFSESGRVDFNLFGWDGPAASWLESHGVFPPRLLGKQKPAGGADQLSLL